MRIFFKAAPGADRAEDRALFARRRMARRAAAAALALSLAPCLFSMDWPAAPEGIAKNFGLNDNGYPRLGAAFEGENGIAAAEEGELLYLRREGDTASRLPSPLGAWAALDHGDGIISIYSRFDGKTAQAVQGRNEKGRLLGRPGISGWSSQPGFYFQLFDRRERRWVNPAVIIGASQDTRPPVINQVRLRADNGDLFDPSQARSLSQGRYVVFVDSGDTRANADERPLAPYRIICSLNGSEAGTLNFDAFSATDGSLMAYRNGLVPARRAYAPVPGYEVAELRLARGQASLEIIAQDAAGNASSAVYRLAVE